MGKDKRPLGQRISDSQPIKVVRQTVQDLSDPEYIKDAGVVTKDEAYRRSAEERARREGEK